MPAQLYITFEDLNEEMQKMYLEFRKVSLEDINPEIEIIAIIEEPE